MRRYASFGLAILSVTFCSSAVAGERQSYGFLRRHPAGVGGEVTYFARDTNTGHALATPQVDQGSAPTPTSAPAPSAPVPVPVSISAHNCVPRLDPRGVSLSLDFSEGAGDCVSFLSPAPAAPRQRGRGPRNPRPSPEQLASSLYDRVISLAPRPELDAAPGRVGLTGLESFFWVARDLEPVTATAGVRGLSVTAEARPVRYLWDFGDGATTETQGPGRPWTRSRPGSVSHLYETKGRYEATVEVVWAARWRVGQGPWRALGYFTTTGSLDYPVREMVAVLVRHRPR